MKTATARTTLCLLLLLPAPRRGYAISAVCLSFVRSVSLLAKLLQT